jgi:hypothetical protein
VPVAVLGAGGLDKKQAVAAGDTTLTIHRVDGETERRAYSQQRAAVVNTGESMKTLLVAIDELWPNR